MAGKNFRYPITSWLPMSFEEAAKRGWDSFDVILVTGDAYIDHPSFGVAIIGRILEAEGYRVGIISQPNWRDDYRDFKKLGRPNLFFGVTAGSMDSMVNHYTAGKRLRSDDAYTAGGKAGFRPDYASDVYTRILKELFPDIPVVLGGIEASMRRMVHYDYWSDQLRPSILESSGADLLVYGMADQVIVDIAAAFQSGEGEIRYRYLPQTAYLISAEHLVEVKSSGASLELPSREACEGSKNLFAEAFRIVEQESNRMEARQIIQPTGTHYLVINPPVPIPDTAALDQVYALPYTRLPHPRYKKRGAIPAWNMIRHSLTIHRGCFGGCSFCTISMHQGKQVISRSEDSILQEVKSVSEMEDFKGHISDLGGPSANMYRMRGTDHSRCKRCSRASCLWPEVCDNLCFDHGPLIKLYRKASSVPGVKKIFIGSGIRYDLITGHPDRVAGKYHLNEYLRQLVRHHVSGRLKVAPEHSDPEVLKMIRKPSFNQYLTFRKAFLNESKIAGLNQQIVPYLIASLPGSDTKAMGNLAANLVAIDYKPEQVQDFTPTPMTMSTTCYYTGINPITRHPVKVIRNERDRKMQRLFLFWYKMENRSEIIRTLQQHGQKDVIRKLFRR
jgi:uncharacterized radical SAM protein YgiQ